MDRRLCWIAPYRLDDVASPRRLSAPQIRDLTFDSTPRNLLATVFFVARCADEQARARCTFAVFPVEATSTRVDVKDGR